MTTLAGRVQAAALAVLLATLVVVGAATAVLLHVRAARSLDQALLAAADAEAHPWQDRRFANDFVRSPVEVRPWTPDDPLVPAALHEQAVTQELPLFVTLGTQRVLLLVVEAQEADERGSTHPHFVVVADAPRVTAFDALPFLASYGLASLVALLLASLALRFALSHALAPLTAATEQVQSVRGLGTGARLETGGVAEVDRLIASTNDLLGRLESAFDAQATFTAQAAHELRTPVTVLKGELELALRRERTPEVYRETLAAAAAEVDRLAELVEGLMLLARVDSGQAERGRVTERLSAVVHQALARERPGLDAAGCAVEVGLDADPEVHVHVALLATAVGNLLRNASVYAPGTPVRVETGADGRLAWVAVCDGGPGLATADRTRVLERFQRGTTRRDGLGLGLPLAREIARRHGGDLVLEEARGGGLRARLTVSSDSNVAPREPQAPPV
ncbi:MAG: HAMP domain-containing histidine kinase [Myxococcales bacterium]|nr:HAMP domain-containing histidine kinase [Myxococcales bacterium]MCB9671143.1 HAMP domain-containing histidine kinase [Alphaproteobacteria bacterium]MCB9691679.1 HAMP domain-containing histidine kinase [Alphaproteobacteria bacterium]